MVIRITLQKIVERKSCSLLELLEILTSDESAEKVDLLTSALELIVKYVDASEVTFDLF